MASSNVKLTPEIDQLTQKLVADPKSRVFAQLADAYRKAGMLDEAIETAKRGLEVHPNYAIAHNILGRCYLEKNMHALAVEEFQLTIRSDPQNLVGYKMLATAFEKQGATDEALKYFRMVLDLEPGEIEVAEKIERLKAGSDAGAPAAPAATPEPESEPRPLEPEPVREAGPSSLVLEDAQPRMETPSPVPPAPEPAGLETAEPQFVPQVETGAAPELVIEKGPEPFLGERGIEPPAAAPAAEPTPPAPATPAGDGEATPTLAEIYAQQGHFEKAIAIYQKLVADSPENAAYKVKLDELLTKAYPDEMSEAADTPPAAEPVKEQSAQPAPPEVPEKMFSQMFAEMEKVATSGELNLPDREEIKSEPLTLSPEPPKDEVRLMPDGPAEPPPAAEPPTPPVMPAPEPVNFGALFASDEKPAAGIEPGAAAGPGEGPKKDDAVSSFQSWLNGLQK